MDPLTNWDELAALKNGTVMPAPADEDFSYYLLEYKDFDNLFDEALTTLQDLDVPSGYGQTLEPPQRSPRGGSRSHSYNMSYARHLKKPSGTAIFGFIDHNRELSLGGISGNEEISRMIKQPQETVKSISPTKLARLAWPVISNEQLDFNFEQPLEACKPIHLNEDDEDDIDDENDAEPAVQKEDEDIIVTNRNPKSYKFPPNLPSASGKGPFISYLGSAKPQQPIHHPKSGKQYPDDINGISQLEGAKMKRYIPIPVREPLRKPLGEPMLASYPSYRAQIINSNNINYTTSAASSYSSQQNFSPQRQQAYALKPDPHRYADDALNMSMNMNKKVNMTANMNMNNMDMNMNVCLPPPSPSSLSQASPEPHSPLPQNHSSPLRFQASLNLSPLAEKRFFYDQQFFSDDAECYYYQVPSQFGSSPNRALPQSSPIRQMNRAMAGDSHADDTIVDVNETILQLTPLKSQGPITPRTNRITLEWSPIISPNGKATKDVRRAIRELSPKRMMKKMSLLPPGELDKYWEGPDDSKYYMCVYQNCGKKFTRRYNVRSHIQTHLSDRPFTCTYCPKSFVRQHDLNRHIKSHMVSKHCRCRCGRAFTRIEGYKKHLANGMCLRVLEEKNGGISKPGHHRIKGETILNGLTSNRLNEDLNLAR